MKNLGDESHYNENPIWDVIEVSKVNDEIIKRLLNYLKSDISENFFISFESLLKLGMKVPQLTLKSICNELDQSSDYKRELFDFIINFIDSGIVEYHLLPQLYSPDFILRARAIMKIKENNDTRYTKFLIPLLDDPDDSVRWSVIKFLTKFKDDKTIYKELKNHLDKELNPIISNNLREIFQ